MKKAPVAAGPTGAEVASEEASPMSSPSKQDELRAQREAMKGHRPTTSPTIELALRRRLASEYYEMTKPEREAGAEPRAEDEQEDEPG
jgi:hypothetical protein